MKRATFFAAVLCLLGAGLSCTHDEPNNSDTGTGQRVVEWQDSTLSGDAVMGEKMIFKVGGGMSVERSEGTRASTDVNGIAKFTVNDLVTIGLTRGATDETKNYKVTATSQTSADPEVWTSSLAYNGSASDAFFWKSTGESVTIRAWSYGDGSTTSSDPDNQTYTLSEDQSANYGELLYSKATSFDYENYSSGIPIQFCHQMTRLVINVTHIKPGDLNISEIYIGDGSETPIPTTAKFHKPTSGNVGTWDNLGSEKGQITPKTETANSCYSAVLIPTTYEVADKKFVVIKTSDGRTYCYIPNENLTLIAGTQYSYTISVKDLKEVSTLTIGDIAAYTYDGTAKTPTPTVKDGTKTLVKDTDYELSYSNNINAGTATVTVTGKGGYYSGSQSKNFTINRCPTTLTFAASSETVDYIWNQTKYNLTKSPSDATVEFTSNNTALVGVDASTGTLKAGTAFISSGSATITATPTGNYTGSAVTYTVTTSKGNYATFSYNGSSSGADGSAQSISLPKATYRMECWGAQGGSPSAAMHAKYGGLRGGYGGYVAGDIEIPSEKTFFVYIGGHNLDYDEASNRRTFSGGWNGGGASYAGSGGGGGTDIRLETASSWDNEASLRSRIIVAGGGGGWDCGRGGEAGGLIGYTGYVNSSYSSEGTGAFGNGVGGNQKSGGTGAYAGSFGKGGGSISYNSGAGGGGWYGGGKASLGYASGGGGSSYISGHEGCVAVKNQSPVTASTAGTDNSVARSKHYSELYFTNTLMIDGGGYEWKTAKQSLYAMPNPSGGNYGSGVGRDGHGYARISFVSQ